jgi:hypothetical protein
MGRIGLSEQEWGAFFDVLHRIVSADGTWEERKSEVEDAASVRLNTPSTKAT